MSTNLHQPVPTGGTAGYLVKLETGGEALCDGPFTVVATGTGSAATLALVGGTGRPVTTTQNGWVAIGKDASGNVLFIPVWI